MASYWSINNYMVFSRTLHWKSLKLASRVKKVNIMLGKLAKRLTHIGTWDIWRQSWIHMYVFESLDQGYRIELVTRGYGPRTPKECLDGVKRCIFSLILSLFSTFKSIFGQLWHILSIFAVPSVWLQNRWFFVANRNKMSPKTMKAPQVWL